VDERFTPTVYAQLRKIAGSYLRGRDQHTLQPTALVHEAFLRLRDEEQLVDRDHFLAVAATAMRQILIDHARKRLAQKRGGGDARVTLDSRVLDPKGGDAAVEVLAVDDALGKLARLSARQARIVELQFFGGMTVEETARVMEISVSLVEKEWRRARAWMNRELAQ
jgi:RNA polymerase sigma-70 factor (ECF subfamily)